MNVLLLSQPSRQAVFMDAEDPGGGGVSGDKGRELVQKFQGGCVTDLSRADAPSLSRMMSLVSSRVGPVTMEMEVMIQAS